MEGLLGQLVELMAENIKRQDRSIELQEETNQKLNELLQGNEILENDIRGTKNNKDGLSNFEMDVIRVYLI